MVSVCKGLIALGFVSLIVGCVSPRPVMSDSGYEEAARWRYGVSRCGSLGYMTPETAARGLTYTDANINSYTWDRAKMAQALARQKGDPNPSQCNQLSVAIAQRQQQIQNNNENAAIQRAEGQQMMEMTRIRQTNCSKIGGIVNCNSY